MVNRVLRLSFRTGSAIIGENRAAVKVGLTKTGTGMPIAKICGWITAAWFLSGFAPYAVMAGDVPNGQNLMQMGGRFGKFMGSFMRELHPGQQQPPGTTPPYVVPTPREAPLPPPARERAEEVRPKRSEPPRGDTHPRREEHRRRSYYPTYDPWGADSWGNPLLDYDPWGAAGFADKDWPSGRHYYGLGRGPWGYKGVYRSERYERTGGYPRLDREYGPSRWGPDRLELDRFRPNSYRYSEGYVPYRGRSYDAGEWNGSRGYADRYRRKRGRRYGYDREW